MPTQYLLGYMAYQMFIEFVKANRAQLHLFLITDLFILDIAVFCEHLGSSSLPLLWLAWRLSPREENSRLTQLAPPETSKGITLLPWRLLDNESKRTSASRFSNSTPLSSPT